MAKTFSKRGRLDIMDEILSLCCTPTQKTHILYKCNLSYGQLTKYLDFLISSKFLKSLSENGRNFSQTTEKGKKFVENHNRIRMLLTEKGKE